MITQLVHRDAGGKVFRDFWTVDFPTILLWNRQTSSSVSSLCFCCLVFFYSWSSQWIPPSLPMVQCPKPPWHLVGSFLPRKIWISSPHPKLPYFLFLSLHNKTRQQWNIFYSDCPIEKQQTLFVLNNKPSLLCCTSRSAYLLTGK